MTRAPANERSARTGLSAGIVVFRRRPALEILLVHPGGPYWRGRDEAGWSFPKGLAEPGEAAEQAARREFTEETGLPAPERLSPLTGRRQPGGKTVQAFLAEADLDLSAVRSNDFSLEWPPRSGRMATFPEIDQAAYFPAAVAMDKLHRGLRPILAEALDILAVSAPPDPGPPAA